MGFTLSEITVYRCINLMFKSPPSLDTNDHFSYQSNMLSLLTSWINFALTYTCSLQFNKYQKKKKNRREVLQTNISFLIVRSIVPWNQYHYITPDGSLAPLFICNMFIRPAGKHTRAHCLWSFSYPQLSQQSERPEACPAWTHLTGSHPGLMRQLNITDVIYCNKPYCKSPRYILWGCCVLPRYSWKHTSLCSSIPGIVSLRGPPVLKNSSGCQLQTALHILIVSNLLQR